MGELTELQNIGPAVEQQLNEVGISTAEELRMVGAEAAWLRILSIDASACIHRLLALEGAICGVRKTLLPEARKAELRAFYRRYRA